jgi:alkyl hydroperoxide reductase subunit F
MRDCWTTSPRCRRRSACATGDDARKPSFAIGRAGGEARASLRRPADGPRVHLAGAGPAAGPAATRPRSTPEVIEQIKALPGDFEFETYISLSCHNCPDVVQALNLMAVLNPRISHVIDGALFQDEVEQRQIMAVPTMFLNGESSAPGRMSIEEILAKLDTGAAARDAEEARAKERLRRAGRRRRPGRRGGGDLRRAQGHPHRRGGRALRRPGAGHLAIENFISVKDTEGPKLAAALEEHVGIRRGHHEPAARRGLQCRPRMAAWSK